MVQRDLVQVEGLRELDEALAELPKATGKNVLKRVLMKAGEPVATVAGSLAPVLKGVLRRSFAVGTKLSKRQKSIHKKVSTVEVFAGAGALPQAHLSEFGSARNRPHRTLTSAWEAKKFEALAGITSDLATEIEKARQRLARKAARIAAKLK